MRTSPMSPQRAQHTRAQCVCYCIWLGGSCCRAFVRRPRSIAGVPSVRQRSIPSDRAQNEAPWCPQRHMITFSRNASTASGTGSEAPGRPDICCLSDARTAGKNARREISNNSLMPAAGRKAPGCAIAPPRCTHAGHAQPLGTSEHVKDSQMDRAVHGKDN